MWKGAAVVVLAATVGTFFLYRETLGYGFHYDDYHFIRPYGAAEVAAAFHGPWDPAGIELPFYRPLTIAFYAARFEAFGLDSRAHHAVSLGLFAVVAALAGALAGALTRRRDAAVAATLVVVVHPSMPYAMTAWVTNQMHLIETIVVLLALTWWALVSRRTLAWWLPLLALGAVAFLIKEDGIMLLPAVIVVHWLRRRLADRDHPPAPRTFVAAAALLVMMLVAARTAALGGLGGYGLPDPGRGWHNYVLGLDRVFRLVPADRPWQAFASAWATATPLAALVLWRRIRPDIRTVIASGIAIALLFNLPFIFVTKNEQMHIVATGAALVLAAAMIAVPAALRSAAWRAAAALVVAAGLTALAMVARDITRDFEPFGAIVLATDDVVLSWAAVPEELRGFLRAKREPGAAGRLSPNPADSLDVVAFGLHAPERSPQGVTYRWMAQPTVELHVAPSVRRLEIPLRHEIGAFREPASVRVEVDGRLADTLVLSDDAWRVSQVALRAGTGSWTRRSHRVRVTIPRVWRPSEMIPGSADARPLGMQVGEIRVR